MRRLAPQLLLLTLLVAAVAQSQSADSLLDEHLDQLRRLSYVSRESVLEYQADGRPVRIEAEVRRRAGKEFIRYLSGPEPYRNVVFSDDGRRYLIYIPAEGRAYRYGTPGVVERRRFEFRHLRTKCSARLEEPESVAARRALHLRFVPREAGWPETHLWLDASTKAVLRYRQMLRGRVWSEVETERIDYDRPPSEDELSYTVPDGTEVVPMPAFGRGTHPEPIRFASAAELRRRTGLRVMAPTYLPQGFRRMDRPYMLHAPMPGNVVRRRLSVGHVSGNRILMLTQSAAPGTAGQEATAPKEVRPGIFFWTRDGVRLALVGPRDIDRNELQRCAESVDWVE